MTKVTASRKGSIYIFCGASALSVLSMEIYVGEQATGPLADSHEIKGFL